MKALMQFKQASKCVHLAMYQCWNSYVHLKASSSDEISMTLKPDTQV